MICPHAKSLSFGVSVQYQLDKLPFLNETLREDKKARGNVKPD